MTKQSSIRLLVVGLLLSVAVGAPVASILGNAPHSTASLAPQISGPAEYEMPEMRVTPTFTMPTVDVVASPPKTARAKKGAGEERATGCTVRRLDSDYRASVKICEG